MLDTYIIEKIKQEELKRQRELDEGRRIWLEIPKPVYDEPKREGHEDEDRDRGTIVIPLHPEVEEEDAA